MAGRGILTFDKDNSAGGRLVLLDTCGQQVWSTDVRIGGCGIRGHAVVGVGETVYLPTGSCVESGIVGVGLDGKIASGPVPRHEVPWLAGADGTLYAADLFGQNGIPQTRVVALSPNLDELWHLDINGGLTSHATAVMSDDGILYAQTSSGVAAIQTTSPGLAQSSWPTYRHDNRLSNWGGGQF